MSFEAGFPSTDVASISSAGLSKAACADLISRVFCHQVFVTGFVHCDPHPANVMLRRGKDGGPAVVLVDHGLYKSLAPDFRGTYCDFWLSIVTADVPFMKKTCEKLNAGEMFPLLAAMVTARPFDEVLDRRAAGAMIFGGGKVKKRRRLKQNRKGGKGGDSAMLRHYAVKYMGAILKLLEDVPRDLPLLLKMNDCLRHIDHELGRRRNDNLKACAGAASRGRMEAVLKSARASLLQKFKAYLRHWLLLARVRLLFGFLLRS